VAEGAEGGPRRRWLAPEAVQASPMDCGPTALFALLNGFGLGVSYARLREACQTDVDGTSIDSLERTARALGLDARQVLVPVDHAGEERAGTLPAIAVTRLPGGTVHFVLVWRRVGRWLQVMDPASGRRWIELERFRATLYQHSLDLPADTWRAFAGGPASAAVLVAALRRLGHRHARERVDEALADPHWRVLAALEAAMRMVRSLVRARALGRGGAAERLLDALFERARRDPSAVPAVYWSVRPAAASTPAAEVLTVRGALLVRARGPLAPAAARPDGTDGGTDGGTDAQPTRELLAALSEPPVRVLRELWALFAGADRRAIAGLALLALVSAAAVLGQALVFRALFELGPSLRLPAERLGAAVALVALVLALAVLELPLTGGVLRLGRHVEARARVAFQERLLRLPQRWFGSRPSSDMAERAHGLFLLRQTPGLAGRVVRSFAGLAFTAAALCWLDPGSTPLVVAAALAAVLLPLLFQRLLAERELLVRSHHGALSRFYLESLLGLVAVRVHGAERALRREHESLLVEWARAGRALAVGWLGLRAATTLAGVAAAVVLVAEHLARLGTTPSALLFGFWALSLPPLGEQLALVVQQVPALRNAALRALEPLGAASADEDGRARPALRAVAGRGTVPAELVAPVPALRAAGGAGPVAEALVDRDARAEARAGGVALALRGVGLTLGGHAVLRDIELDVAAGEHVALVGRSGAGKSSLFSLLLGLQHAGSGAIRADGRALTGEALEELRRELAWVDPGVQIWNRSAFENLVYGLASTDEDELARALERAELSTLAGALPGGLATPLGEGGGFLSGGEGQRLRLARGLLRPGVRLALLDEPFRGLDRATRRRLLARAREHWRTATLLCATHDLEETRAFDRVVVLEDGRVLEQGAPAELAARPDSRYARLLAAERRLEAEGWRAGDWTRWRVADGTLARAGGPSA